MHHVPGNALRLPVVSALQAFSHHNTAMSKADRTIFQKVLFPLSLQSLLFFFFFLLLT